MKWYKNMTNQQRHDFQKVLAVSIAGFILVLFVPFLFHALS